MFVVGGRNKLLFILSYLSFTTRKGVIVIVTIGDLIKQGIIRQYIPPHKGGNSEGVKEEKPVALQDSSEIMQEVFQAWIMSDVAGKRRKRKALKDM